MTDTLLLNINDNTATFGGCNHAFKRRYEALFLMLLAEIRATGRARAIQDALLQRAAAQLGQQQPLNKKQISRLLESIESGLIALGLSKARAKIAHAPATRTIGPWWWPALETLSVAATSDMLIAPFAGNEGEAPAGAPAKFHLTQCGGVAAARAILWRIFEADAYLFDGEHQLAVEVFEALTCERALTIEARILVHTRLARAYGTARAFDEASAHLNTARSLAAAKLVTAALHRSTIDILEHCQLYSRRPVASAPVLRDRLALDLASLTTADTPNISPEILGQSYNLRGLTTRRAIEALPADCTKQQQDTLITDCIGDFINAAYCSLCARNAEMTQNILSNFAYALQKIAARGWLDTGSHPSNVEVCEWYRLSFTWNLRFNLADDNVWEAIYFGEYWLGAGADRPRFDDAKNGGTVKPSTGASAQAKAGPIWQGQNPSQLAFYERALTRAHELGEARQELHAALNMHRFCTEFGNAAALRRAEKAIRRLRELHPDVIEVLLAEGYVVPG